MENQIPEDHEKYKKHEKLTSIKEL